MKQENVNVEVLATDKQLEELFPVVVKFCSETNAMTLAAALTELVRAVFHDTYSTIIGCQDGKIVAYLTAMFNPQGHRVFITQAYSEGGRSISKQVYEFFEQGLRQGKFRIIEFSTQLNPRVFEGYGFTPAATIMRKELDNGTNMANPGSN